MGKQEEMERGGKGGGGGLHINRNTNNTLLKGRFRNNVAAPLPACVCVCACVCVLKELPLERPALQQLVQDTTLSEMACRPGLRTREVDTATTGLRFAM